MSNTFELLRPIEKTFIGQDGKKRKYLLGEIPYGSGGREVGTQYMTTGAPKIGDYKANENLAWIIYKNVAFVAAQGNEFLLDNAAMINNHVPDFKTGIAIEAAMLENLLGFSIAGKLQEYRTAWTAELPALITKILTLLKQSSLESDKQPLSN